MNSPLLSIENLRVDFPVSGGVVRAVDGVSLQVNPGETVAIVGESGCGKTTLARAILGLQPISDGQIRLGTELVEGVPQNIGARVGMVWQDPYASLDPRWRVGKSIAEPLTLAKRSADVVDLLELVGLEARFESRFPHQLSGGQRQRVAIGRALALRPPLVICDEPTAALDLSVRAQILNLLKDLQQRENCSFFYISHDLTTVRFLADRVAVMYLGRIVESGPTEELFHRPRHPYTKALIDSAPSLERMMYLPEPLEGEIPDPRTRFPGCRFEGRCPNAQPLCVKNDPLPTIEGARTLFCHFPVPEDVIMASQTS